MSVGPDAPYSKRRIVRWPAAVALIAIAAAYLVISDELTPGPRLALPVVVVAGIALLSLARFESLHRFVRPIAFAIIAGVTLTEATSTLLLINLLPRHEAIPALNLLRDAALIWGVNILAFALWYWEIDGGGPVARHERGGYEPKDFLFPQCVRNEGQGGEGDRWSPNFLDYLFLAFNQSTAFSPTDTAVLSRRAKVLVMIQATLSLMAIAVLAAKAINSLGS